MLTDYNLPPEQDPTVLDDASAARAVTEEFIDYEELVAARHQAARDASDSWFAIGYLVAPETLTCGALWRAVLRGFGAGCLRRHSPR